jgi:hypothetical protein
VVHRLEAATGASGCHVRGTWQRRAPRAVRPAHPSGRGWQPEGRLVANLGLRRGFGTMNHIALSTAPCRGSPQAVLIGQDHRRLVYDLNESAWWRIMTWFLRFKQAPRGGRVGARPGKLPTRPLSVEALSGTFDMMQVACQFDRSLDLRTFYGKCALTLLGHCKNNRRF